MIYLIVGGGLFAAYLWLTGGRIKPKRREWRFISGAAAVVALAAAAFVSLRGAWGAGIVLAVFGVWLASATRQAGSIAPPPATGRMSQDEARRILGVGQDATKADIQAAYARLMRAVHPDKGGTAGLAAQLNAARDRLLGK